MVECWEVGVLRRLTHIVQSSKGRLGWKLRNCWQGRWFALYGKGRKGPV